MTVTYAEDPAATLYFLGWNGPPGLDFQRRMKTLEYRQAQAAPRRTGRMAAQVGTKRMQSDPGRYLEAAVGVNPGSGRRGYALYQSQGTRPHIIAAKRARALRFTVAGRTVFTKTVRHPGTRPNTYLTRHLNEFVR